MHDLYSNSINSPAGRLAEILLKKLPKVSGNGQLPIDMRLRLDKLMAAPGNPGKLARIRLAAAVAFLFEQAPEWTNANIIPLFEWAYPEAGDAWSALKYANYIGSPELFRLMKASFLELFGRSDITSEELRIFADWLTTILISNRNRQSDPYSLSALEARAALRRAGAGSLASVGHRLATEMERAKPQDKAKQWRSIVGPVLESIWPIDVDIQSNSANFKLVQILISTGDAFLEAAKVIIPLLRPEDTKSHPTVYSIANAPKELFKLSSSTLLDILVALVGEVKAGNIHSLDEALSRIRKHGPGLANSRKFQKLLSLAAT